MSAFPGAKPKSSYQRPPGALSPFAAKVHALLLKVRLSPSKPRRIVLHLLGARTSDFVMGNGS